jgi:hypothetical protein
MTAHWHIALENLYSVPKIAEHSTGSATGSVATLLDALPIQTLATCS